MPSRPFAAIRVDALPSGTSRSSLLHWLTRLAGLHRDQVGDIELHPRHAIIEVPADSAAHVVAALDGATLQHRSIRASLVGSNVRTPAQLDDHEHFSRLLRLLDVESDAEAEQTLRTLQRLTPEAAEQTGNSLVDLVLADDESGLGGRTLVTLTKRGASRLPWTRLNLGTPVLLSPNEARTPRGQRGIVSDRTDTAIQVALDHWDDSTPDSPLWRVDLANDETARERQRTALERARAARGDRLADLRDLLLGRRPARFLPPVPVTPFDRSLNDSQREAVEFALSAEDLAIVHGPPGTGKTTTIVEIIRQTIARGEKVLACAPSNLAVDNIFERLLAAGVNAVRLGHPARVLPELRDHTLDLLVEAHPDVRAARRLAREAAALRAKAARYTRHAPRAGYRNDLRAEARELLADARRWEAQITQSILDEAPVLCVTTTGLDSEILGQRRFDLAIIDEAAQSTEPGCWIPLLRADRLILAGDHCQLPPTILSDQARKEGFGISLMERLVDRTGDQLARLLTVQYRMHEQIMGFSSQHFYSGQLRAHPTVAAHLLTDDITILPTDLTSIPLRFIDTAGAGYVEELEPEGESRRNPEEASLIGRLLDQLDDAGLAPEQIALVTPYAAQARLLRTRYSRPGLEIDTIDGFQGREKDVILLSLVRSNDSAEIGFLADTRRMNVALTRARKLLVIVADSATIGEHPFFRALLEDLESRNAYHTVWEQL